jgi:hypothetical protein
VEATAALPCCRECFKPLVIPLEAGWMICGSCKMPYAHVKLALVLLCSNPNFPVFDE